MDKIVGAALLLSLGIFCSVVQCQEQCYGPLGCFTNESPFSFAPLGTPMLPEPRDVIDVTYSLFVRHDVSSGVTIANAAFTSVNISQPFQLSHNAKLSRKWRQLLVATKQTKIIIHDYGDTSLNAWVFAMIENFLENSDCHVITVNWTSRDEIGGYYQAAANTRVVGAEIALLIKNIKDWKSEFEFESVHLIGHGLGAHAASYVGEIFKVDDNLCVTKQSHGDNDDGGNWWELPSWLRSRKTPKKEPESVSCPKIPQLGQITGLDPAGLWFEGAKPGARLDASDAIFVDVIHTDVMKKLTSYFVHGIFRESGNIDFYPNGGFDQPGCGNDITGLEQLAYSGSREPTQPMDCNHYRSIVYYLSTMPSNSCSMTSFPCSNWYKFLAGECTSSFQTPDPDSSSSSWFSYFGLGRRSSASKRTKPSASLKMGPTSIKYWRDHKRRAKVTGSDVTNIKAFLKTSDSAPYCLKYMKLVLELTEPTAEGELSFSLRDRDNHKAEWIEVGRVSNWGAVTKPSYMITVPSSFTKVEEITVLWNTTSTISWWPGIGGGSIHTQDSSRRELKLPLKKIEEIEVPTNEVLSFCSNRKKLRSGRETRFTLCGTEPAYDYEE